MKRQPTATAAALAWILILGAPAGADQSAPPEGSWQALEGREAEIEAFAAGYMGYLGRSQTELRAVAATARLARRAGLREVAAGEAPPTDRPFFVNHRDRAIVLVRPGREPLSAGARIIASHIDSPRLDLKARPLYEDQGFVLWQTVPHGGIKYYQWANVPLALVGHVDRIDAGRVEIEIGLDEADPVFLIPDLAPHVDRPRRSRTSREVIQGEELDPVAGSRPGEEDAGAKDRILQYLLERYGIEESDFVSAELSLVPAAGPREVGLDRSMIVGYGQDDKICSYAGLRALLETRRPRYWAVVYLADNEETGSGNNTGARSQILEELLGTWLEAEGAFDYLSLRRAMARSVVASADVTTGINPMDPGVQEPTNASRLGGGVVIKRYGHGTDANSEVLADVRRILRDEGLPWQTHTYKVDVGGGGTLGGFLSRRDMDVFDVGVPLLSLHAPAELASKADLYALYLFFEAFLEGTPASADPHRP